jgi:hypothetical protein
MIECTFLAEITGYFSSYLALLCVVFVSLDVVVKRWTCGSYSVSQRDAQQNERLLDDEPHSTEVVEFSRTYDP